MRIRGAVLEKSGVKGPFATTLPLSVSELELGAPGTGELLIKIEAAGLCHSDLSVITGDRPRPLPMLLGHEACGIVQSVGQGTHSAQPGDKVVLSFLPQCGKCDVCVAGNIQPCSAGTATNTAGTLLSGEIRLARGATPVHHHLGVSAFADYAVVSEKSVVVIDAAVPSEIGAVLGCAVLTGGGAVLNVAQPHPGQSIAVVGLGGVGMAAVLAAQLFPDVAVVAIDLSLERLASATRLGCHRAMTPDEAREENLRVDFALEAAGNAHAFETAIEITAHGGTTISVGLPNPRETVSISPLRLVAEGRRIVGSYMGSSVPSRDIPRFLDFWRAGNFPIGSLVTSTLGLSEINAGMDQLAKAQGIRQVMIP